jgi:hypothetical protein
MKDYTLAHHDTAQRYLYRMVTMSFQSAQTCSRVLGSALLASFSLALPCLAQEVLRIYPPYAVVGQEARFTAEGVGLSKLVGPGVGMKHSFSKSVSCVNPNRFKPATGTRYYFSCKLEEAPPIAKLTVLVAKKAKPAIKLWSGPIQILSAAPKISSVILAADGESRQTNVRCDSGSNCITFVGEIAAGKPVNLEVSGSNLPHSLFPVLDGCIIAPRPHEWTNTTNFLFQCAKAPAGNSRLQFFTAPPNESGEMLFNQTIQLGS